MDSTLSPSVVSTPQGGGASRGVHSTDKRRRLPTSPAGKAKREAALKPFGDYYRAEKLAGRWKDKE